MVSKIVDRFALLVAAWKLPALVLLLAPAAPLHAAPPAANLAEKAPAKPATAPTAAPAVRPIVRELFVPFEDLNVVLDAHVERIFMTRPQYEQLIAKARVAPKDKSPRSVVMLSTEYQGRVEEGRMLLTGTIGLDVLNDGLHAVPLALGGVGLRQATIDGRAAPLGVDERRQPVLFVEGKGRKKVELTMVAALETSAALQSLAFQLPASPTARIDLEVPGNVEVKGGATVLRREVDAAGAVTRFQLLLPPTPTTLVMTLNNRQLMKQRAVVARSVFVDEITQAYERLHATVSLGVLYGAVEQVQFALPDGFEVTSVVSPLLARWSVDVPKADAKDGSPKPTRTLTIALREPTTETVVVNVSAVRTPVDYDRWQLPRLEPLDVAGQASVVGLLVEERWKAESLAPVGLIPIDTTVLRQALPESVFQAEPGAASLRSLAAYFAPDAKFSLSARFARPPARLETTSNQVLVLDEKKHQLRGTFTVTSIGEKLFAFDIAVPTGWQVLETTDAQGKPLTYETYPADVGSRVRVRLAAGQNAGMPLSVNFRAEHVPDGWLNDWRTAKATFPVFAVLDAARDEGALAVQTLDDLLVRPDKLEQLVPLDENEKAGYGLEGIATDLVYRYEGQPYAATFQVERASPEITARTFSFFRVETDRLLAHYELAYDVRTARTQTLGFTLPVSTPTAISVVGLDGVVVKEYNAEPPPAVAENGDKKAETQRAWSVTLDQRRSGRIRLQVSWELPLGEVSATVSTKRDLPPIVADAVYQSGLVAVEGNAELDVAIDEKGPRFAELRKVDVGELAEADYQVGRRLLAAYGFVGAAPTLRIEMTRRPGFALPAAIVQRAELVTLVAVDGAQATAARFHLRTKSLLLEIRLPADARLWSVQIDGKPMSPQRSGESLLLNLPAVGAATLRDLQLVYESSGAGLSLLSRVESLAPRLFLKDDQGGATEIPVADVRWTLRLPTGYRVTGNRGTVQPDLNDRATLSQFQARPSPWSQLASLGERLAPSRSFTMIATDSRTSGRAGGVAFESHGKAAATRDESRSMEMATPPASDLADADFDAMKRPRSPTSMPAPTAATSAPDKPNAPPLPSEPLVESKPADGPVANGMLPNAVDGKKFDMKAEGGRRYEQSEMAGAKAGQVNDPTYRQSPFGRDGSERNQEELARSKSKRGAFQEELLADDVRDGGWTLEGVRSLPFEFTSFLQTTGSMLAFESLGEDPELRVVVTNEPRLASLGWGLALLTVVGGLAMLPRPAASKFKLVMILLAVTTVVPLLLPWEHAVGTVSDMVFWAAWLLIGVYLLVGLTLGVARWCGRRCGGLCARVCGRWRRPGEAAASTATIAVLVLAGAFGGSPAAAQTSIKLGDQEIVIPLGERLAPVKVPADAIIVPYDAGDENGVQKAEKILVPYGKYVELWNLANADPRRTAERPSAPYALAGTAYRATLDGDESLTIRGRLEIELFVDEPIDVPLALSGGMLAAATVDGQPARLRMVRAVSVPSPVLPPQTPPQMQPQQQAINSQAAARPAPAPPEILALVLSGKGRKTLELTVRLRLERRGGWRIAEGKLPVASASSLTIETPQPQTEVRLAGVTDRPKFETTKAGETIETALVYDAPLSIQWRPKVTEGEVDTTLTARSQAEFEVRDDALRLAWQVKLEFPRSRRENFSFEAPTDYLVERVVGPNVRGWTAAVQGERQKIDVTLLKAAVDSDSFTIYLSKRGRAGVGPLASFSLPAVRVTDSLLHQGVIAVRRSPLLDLRIHDLRNLVRTDAAAATPIDAAGEESVLVSRAFQTFRFPTVDYAATLTAAELPASVSARWQSVLRITDRMTKLESRVSFKVEQRPVYRLRLRMPKAFDVEQVQLAGDEASSYDWTVADDEPAGDGAAGAAGGGAAGGAVKTLSIQLTSGKLGDFSLVIAGSLGRRKESDPVEIPRLRVLDVVDQQGDIVVQVDPAMQVTAEQLQGCESVLLSKNSPLVSQRYGWLSPAQRDVSRLAIGYRSPDYSGVLRLSRRQPSVACFTVTNIRVTPRAIEETIGLDFHIQNAGVREVSFLLPAWLRTARVNTRLLRQKTVEDAPADPASADGQPLVRFRLEFQDEVMGLLQVVVQNDRLLTSAPQQAPIPIVEAWPTDERLVALESAGRSEVVFEKEEGVERVGREQKSWRRLQELFGENITVAYAARSNAVRPNLTYRTKERALVETAAARIGLAETELQLDAGGAYRGRVTYRVDNSTEPFLVAQLPRGAKLWTTLVAGQPVKPTEAPGGASDLVRIPLVKTAPGDADFPVVLTYAGRLPSLGASQSVQFPFVKTTNIRVELSLVRLLLPPTHRWMNFDGTLGQVANEGDFKATYFEYQTKQVQKIARMMQGDVDPLTMLRSRNNLKQLEAAVGQYAESNSYLSSNELFFKNRADNNAALQQAQQQLDEQSKELEQSETQAVGNRQRLNSRLDQQQADRAKNVVGKLGANFDAPQAAPPARPASAGETGAAKGEGASSVFNPQWFLSNSLASPATPQSKSEAGEKKGAGQTRAIDREDDRRAAPGKPSSQPQSGKQAVPNEAFRQQLRAIDEVSKLQKSSESNKESGQEVTQRYQQRLERQQDANQAPGNAPQIGKDLSGGPFANPTGAAKAAPSGDLGGGGGMGGGGMGGPGGVPPMVRSPRQAGNVAAPGRTADGEQALQDIDVANATVLASLDVELPQRGEVYLFKTPRGEVELTGLAVDESLARRSGRLLWTLVVLAAIGGVWLGGRRFVTAGENTP